MCDRYHNHTPPQPIRSNHLVPDPPHAEQMSIHCRPVSGSVIVVVPAPPHAPHGLGGSGGCFRAMSYLFFIASWSRAAALSTTSARVTMPPDSTT